MNEEPKPGTWGAVTRATGEEHERFKRAMNKLFITKEEFLTHGPTIVFMKYYECVKELKKGEKNE